MSKNLAMVAQASGILRYMGGKSAQCSAWFAMKPVGSFPKRSFSTESSESGQKAPYDVSLWARCAQALDFLYQRARSRRCHDFRMISFDIFFAKHLCPCFQPQSPLSFSTFSLSHFTSIRWYTCHGMFRCVGACERRHLFRFDSTTKCSFANRCFIQVVVFGGSGFVGSNVCKILVSKGKRVASVNRSGAPSKAEPWTSKVDFIAGITNCTIFEAHEQELLCVAATLSECLGIRTD